MIVEWLRTLMLEHAPIAAALGTRIYPVQLPDAPTYPAVVLARVAGIPERDLTGNNGFASSRVQVDVYSVDGYAETGALARTIKNYLSGLQGVGVSGTPCAIDQAICINDADLAEPSTERAGPRLRRRLLEFRVWHRED